MKTWSWSLLCTLLLGSCSSYGPPVPDARLDGAPDVDGLPAGPRLQVTPARLDFGLHPCGAAAPAPQKLSLSNAGTATLTWRASLLPAGKFSLADPVTGSLEPGASVELTVSPPGIEASASAGAPEQATVSIISNDLSRKNTLVPVQLVAAGGQLQLLPASADFGLVPLGAQATDLPLQLVNTGNQKISVGFGQPASPQFSLVWTGAPKPVELLPGGSVPGLLARFKPTSASATSSSAVLQLTGTLCGTNPTAIPMLGQGSSGVVGIQPGSLDFGKVGCGAVAAGKSIRLSNAGSTAFAFTAKLSKGQSSPYTVSPASGSVPAGGSVSLGLTPKPIPSTSLTTPDLYGDTLELTTTAPADTPHQLALHQTARGARLAFNPSTISLGEVPVSTSRSAPLEVVNSGNGPATVTLTATGEGFDVSPDAPTLLVAAGTLSTTVAFTPLQAEVETGNIGISAATADVLCAPLPGPVGLSGTGSSGVLAISSSELSFGEVDCGKTAAAQELTLQSSGSSPLSWSASLGKGAASHFDVSPAAGTVAPAGSATLTVTPKPIPATASTAPGSFSDTLTLTTNLAGDQPHLVQLSLGARGAVLVIQPSAPLSFGNVPAGTSPTLPFTVANTGNAAASVSFQITSSPPFSLAETGPFLLEPEDSQESELIFEPLDAGPRSASLSLSVSSSTVLCAPAPSRPVTGTGTKGSVGVSAAALDFGNVACGSQGAAQTLVVSNAGTAPYTFTVDLAGLGELPYTVSPLTGTIAPGGTRSLTVTPPGIPAEAAVTPNLFGDTLTISTDMPGDLPRDVALHLTAHGAILSTSVPFLYLGDVAVGATGSGQFVVSNTGNASASVSYSPQNPVFKLSPQGALAVAKGSYTATASFTPAAAQLYSETIAFSVPAGTPVCAPLPAIELEGTGE